MRLNLDLSLNLLELAQFRIQHDFDRTAVLGGKERFLKSA